MTKNAPEGQANKPDNLVTERDIDPDFGLFTEGSFPGALEDEDQREAIEHAVPEEPPSDKPSSDEN